MYKIFLVRFFCDRIFTTFVIGHSPLLRSDLCPESDRIFPRNPIGLVSGFRSDFPPESDRTCVRIPIGFFPGIRSDFPPESDRIFSRNPIGFLPGSDRVIRSYLSFRPDQVGWSDHPIILPDRVPESPTDDRNTVVRACPAMHARARSLVRPDYVAHFPGRE